MTDRETQINNILNNFKSQKEWELEKMKHIDNMQKKYKEYLEDYNLVQNKEEYDMCKLGGYIRYIDNNDIMKWGGILIKKIQLHDIDYMVVLNSQKQSCKVSFNKNIIFYKKHMTANDKTRKLFISYLD